MTNKTEATPVIGKCEICKEIREPVRLADYIFDVAICHSCFLGLGADDGTFLEAITIEGTVTDAGFGTPMVLSDDD